MTIPAVEGQARARAKILYAVQERWPRPGRMASIEAGLDTGKLTEIAELRNCGIGKFPHKQQNLFCLWIFQLRDYKLPG
jgi:hypothetical protein